MSQETSLLRNALVAAQLTAEQQSGSFWEVPLGKNARAEEVHAQLLDLVERQPR